MRLSHQHPYSPLPLASYHPSSDPEPPCDVFLTSMIGRAFLEWNSKIGVPSDVWYIIATAKVLCQGDCKMVRSFDGDCAHRGVDGEPVCTVVDLSQEDSDTENVVPPATHKGKGKAL